MNEDIEKEYESKTRTLEGINPINQELKRRPKEKQKAQKWTYEKRSI